MEETFGVRNAVACGIWSDSKNVNYDRTESLEVLTLAFPVFSGPKKPNQDSTCGFWEKVFGKAYYTFPNHGCGSLVIPNGFEWQLPKQRI